MAAFLVDAIFSRALSMHPCFGVSVGKRRKGKRVQQNTVILHSVLRNSASLGICMMCCVQHDS